METIMNATIIAACLLASIGSAFAQNGGNKSTAGGGTAAQANPASAGEAIGQPASAGTGTSSDQGSLMQQRQKAMSPQGSSGGAATGKMKQ
jgi:parvulin-like peptidyl-prolyl isomerase